jgi:hypothetical protein
MSLLIMKAMQGNENTVINLANIIIIIIKKDNMNGMEEKLIDMIVTPKYAKTKASARYPTDSKMRWVPN